MHDMILLGENDAIAVSPSAVNYAIQTDKGDLVVGLGNGERMNCGAFPLAVFLERWRAGMGIGFMNNRPRPAVVGKESSDDGD